MPGTPTWEVVSEGGSLTDNGLFTASTVAGTFVDTVRAFFQANSGELEDTVSFTMRLSAVSRVLIGPWT